MQLYVYDSLLGGFSRFSLHRAAPLPYTDGAPVLLHDFLGSTTTETVWTDRELLSAFGALAAQFGAPITVCGGFRRVLPGRSLCTSPRCAGLMLDVGADLCAPERERLRRLAVQSGLFETVLPEYVAPTWVGLQKRVAPACAPGCPFQELRPGNSNSCVFAVQDALAVHGFPPDCGLTGRFCAATERALRAFCRARRTPYAGIADAGIWRAL